MTEQGVPRVDEVIDEVLDENARNGTAMRKLGLPKSIRRGSPQTRIGDVNAYFYPSISMASPPSSR